MDDELERLVKILGEAINDSINDSSSVNAALDQLRAAGHDAFLVLEATIAFKDKAAAEPTLGDSLGTPSGDTPLQELSKEDEQFLRSLRIRLDPEE